MNGVKSEGPVDFLNNLAVGKTLGDAKAYPTGARAQEAPAKSPVPVPSGKDLGDAKAMPTGARAEGPASEIPLPYGNTLGDAKPKSSLAEMSADEKKDLAVKKTLEALKKQNQKKDTPEPSKPII